MKKLFLFLILLAVGFTACRDDFENTTVTETTYQPPVIKVIGSLAGRVINENGQAIANANVIYGSNTTLTDDNGFFQFENMEMNQNGTYVRANISGYFEGSTRFFPEPNSLNYTTIRLLEKSIAGNVQGSAGGTVQTADGATIQFEPNSFLDESGQLYTGTVLVAARWIDPTASNLLEIMPGNLQGVNSDDQEVVLGSFGMMAVELNGEDGRVLQLADESPAELSFPLPSALQASAPATIPLWHFDETLGLWVEEGQAELQGNVYVGQVTHFSFWNCDAPFPLIKLKGTVVSEGSDGSPIKNVGVRITFVNNGASAWGRTNDDGIFSGKVPKGEALVIEIINPCGEVIFSQNIGPFDSDTDIGNIVVNNASAYVAISGSLVNCDMDPVLSGYALISAGDYSQFIVVSDENGSFETNFLVCNATAISVKGIDLDALKESLSVSFAIENEIDAGIIEVCDQDIAEFITFSSDTENREAYLEVIHSDMSTYDSLGTSGNYLFGFFQDTISSGFIEIGVNSLAPGTYTGLDVNFITSIRSSSGGSQEWNEFLCGQTQLSCDNFTVTITSSGGIGDDIVGEYSGTVYLFSALGTEEKFVSGSFKVEREF